MTGAGVQGGGTHGMLWLGRGEVLGFGWWVIGALWFEAPGDGGGGACGKRERVEPTLGGGRAGCEEEPP